MASTESEIIRTELFVSRANKNQTLKEAVASCGETFDRAKTVALLYAPHKCFLALVKKVGEEWRFYEGSSSKGNGKEINKEKAIAIDSVFEARVFNDTAELRWLNEANGEGAAVVLCEDNTKRFFNVDAKSFKPMNNDLVSTIKQTYLLWGESVGASDNGWTKFAEARIGSFFVPVKGVTARHQRAQFTAVEYLGEYEDGNVAVAEERLTGIEKVS